MARLIECVPNFSEGKDSKIIQQIADALDSVEGARVLDVDPGKSTNRTVVTVAGLPEAVAEAAFRGIQAAAQLIDMRKHKGEHPRMGATDVCPFVPISDVSIEEAVELARKLGKRVGEELNIPVYLYEYAATSPQRKSLADIRSGEYEGFAQKILQPEWKPDFGPQEFNPTAGQTVIGVREFLVAYNINLNTTSTRRANAIAYDVRESGRVKLDENWKPVKDENGQPVVIPGKLKHCRAIGWYIEEYGICQVSINLTNLTETPLHRVFEEVEKSAYDRGIRVTGSELVGLIPKSCLVEAGKYFLKKQNRSVGLPEKELIRIAVKTLGLDELSPFDPEKKIIENRLAEPRKLLVDKTVVDFANEVASESVAPGGGSIAALVGALGAALGSMVANLSAHKGGWDHRTEEFSDVAVVLENIKQQLLDLVDEDTAAFNHVLEANRKPLANEAEKIAKQKALNEANLYAIDVPLRTMKVAVSAYPAVREMILKGNPTSITDAGVGALCLRTAIHGAAMNVKTNLVGWPNAAFKEKILNEVAEIFAKSEAESAELAGLVEKALV